MNGARTRTQELRLARAARAALGGGRRLAGIERIAGGTTKGVFRLTMDDAATAVAYVWEDAENYWPPSASGADLTEPFSGAVGLDLFEASYRRLTALGVRVPALYAVDRDYTDHPADVAVVEDLPGQTLEQLLESDPRGAEHAMAQLAEMLELMRTYRAPGFGTVALVDAGGSSRGASCEAVVFDRALRDLEEAAGRDPRIAEARDRLAQRLLTLRGRVGPRAEYSVVHGELGPDHVRIDSAGNPVVIDIDELMYFDVEWEHVFLQIRLHETYRRLAVDGLDADRFALYMLAQRLSLVAGPLRLLDGPFPDRAFMQQIAEYNLHRALELATAEA